MACGEAEPQHTTPSAAGRRLRCRRAKLPMRLRTPPRLPRGGESLPQRWDAPAHAGPRRPRSEVSVSVSRTHAYMHTHTHGRGTRGCSPDPQPETQAGKNIRVTIQMPPFHRLAPKRDLVFRSLLPSQVGEKNQHSRGAAGSPPRNHNGVGKCLERSHLGQQDRPLGQTPARPDAHPTYFLGPCVK